MAVPEFRDDIPVTATAVAPVAVEGRNCWRRVAADRAAVLIDGQAYYTALKDALLQARESILLIGWDIDSRTVLDREPDASEPNTLGALLDLVVRSRPALRVHVLIWDTAIIYSWQREFWTELKFRWLTPRRLRFRLDNNHPLGASHHQKIVVIDDAIAFVGGFDVSSGRWDTPAHASGDPRRNDPVVGAYAPFHDVALLLSGPAAAALGELARLRWLGATGRQLRPPPPAEHDPWPRGVRPLMRNVTVAIARTSPAWEGEPEIREVERLYLDMIAGARSFLYLENQFFASRAVGRALLARLQEETPPDIVVVSCQEPVAFLERATMGLGRARLYARLRNGDRHGRLRLYTPVVPGGDVKVHSKVTIVDDRLLRIGSANLNNRSMGLDTECDLLIEALGDPAVEEAIRQVRCTLLGEHLGVAPPAVARETRTRGVLHGIEALRGAGGRSLVPLEATMPEEWAELLLTGDVFDPDRPLEEALAEQEPVPGRAPRRLLRKVEALAVLLCLVAVAAAAARWLLPHLPVDFSDAIEVFRDLRLKWIGLVFGFGTVVAAGLTPLPVTLLLAAAGAIYGSGTGFAVGLTGATASALLAFAIGRWIGRDRVRLLSGAGMARVVRAMPRHGVLVVTMLRLLPVAPFVVVNLVAGAARIRILDFLIGTFLGMVPIAGTMALFGDRAAAVLRAPNAFNMGVLAALTAAVIVVQHSLARRLGKVGAAVKEGRNDA